MGKQKSSDCRRTVSTASGGKNVDDPEEPNLGVIRGLEIQTAAYKSNFNCRNSFTSSVRWTYVLIAPASGEYLIPPLKVGKEKRLQYF